MSTGLVSFNNRTQVVRLPAESRFPDGVKKVTVRVLGHDCVRQDLGQLLFIRGARDR